MKKWLIFTIAALLASGGGMSLAADAAASPSAEDQLDPQPDTDTDTDTDSDDDVVKGAAVPSAKLTELSQQLGVPEERVTAMLGSGMGNGEAFIAMSLANKLALASDPPLAIGDALDQILAARASGQGWGQIAKANGLKLGQVVSESQKAINADLRAKDRGDVRRAEQPSAHGKPDAVNKPEKPDKVAKVEKAQKPDKPEKPPKPAKPDKVEKVDKPQKPDKPDKPHGRPGA